MIEKVKRYIKEQGMIKSGDGVVLGISGGADSVSLFFVLVELRQIYDLKIIAVHVNHGIRGEEAEEDENYVKKLCASYDVPLECVHADVKGLAKENRLSEEEMGRKVRYEAFERIANKYQCNRIAIAHNQNDVSETVLFNLFRGSGLKGISGIEPVRGKIIRPLLCVKREEIEQYLGKRKITFQTDSTNLHTEYTRNKIRLNVIPYVEKNINSLATEHIVHTAGLVQEAKSFIEQQVDMLYEDTVRKEKQVFVIMLELFSQAHSILKKELVRRVLFEICGAQKDIEQTHVEMIIKLSEGNAGKKINLPYGVEAIHEYDRIKLRKKVEKCKWEGFEEEATIPGILNLEQVGLTISFEIIEVNEGNWKDNQKIIVNMKNSYTKWFDYDKIKSAVLVRTRQTGDYFECNSDRNTKKLKNYFIDEKIPVESRDRIVLLADGNHIIWIVGFRISEYYKVSSDTHRILKVKIDGGD